ncbi:DEP domain-containing mTOR-interacting protein-like [Hyperolius riggenbachi]|uniref:DEP domain-containing mTOR-interacting protein-like n=1 Tax=Hyperolius riggenbachi TaxID=752182 RepID=UPI0035A30840
MGPDKTPGIELVSNSMRRCAELSRDYTEIRLAGEQLRLRLHNAKLVKERRVNTFTYPRSFIAKEVVTWLVDHKEAPDRATAIRILQKLLEAKILHHVVDKYKTFKDADLFYRFRADDGTLIPTQEMKVMARGQRLYESLVNNKEDLVMKLREVDLVKYKKSFPGVELLDWMERNGAMSSRKHGLRFCRSMVECGVIEHVTGLYHFSDSDLLYRFCINFQRRRKMMEILNSPSTYDRRQDSPEGENFSLDLDRPQDTFVWAHEPPPERFPRNKSLFTLPSSAYYGRPIAQPIMCLPSVLKRPVSVEELLAPGAPYVRKTLNIIGDAVGWGFVPRGKGPCHIQALDPGGPAANAGMKIRQFIVTVNGLNCLRMENSEIYKFIVNGPQHVIMEVLEPVSKASFPRTVRQ